MKSRPARIATQSVAGGEKTKEQLKEELRKTREEVAIQKWGMEKTLKGMKALVKQLTKTVLTEKKEVDTQKWGLEKTLREMKALVIELIQKKKELAETNAKNEAILTSIADGCIAINESGEIILINQMAQKMLGYTSKESIGKKWYEILHREDESGNPISPEKGAIRAALSSTTTTTTTTSFYYLRKDGTKFPVSRTVSPITLQGKIIGAVNIFRNITKEQESERSKTEFISIASHQLRTPISAFNWITEALQLGDQNLTPKQRGYVKDLSTMARRLIELVEDLLDFSRIQLGSPAVTEEHKHKIEIPGFIKEFVKEMMAEATSKKHSIILKNEIAGSLIVEINKEAFYNVLQNILSNAIDYSPENTAATVVLEKVKDYLRVSISNKGPAIPKADQPHIFERFYRAESAKKMKVVGTGLGLYVAKALIEEAGGKIGFESAEGKDTMFWFTIPLKLNKKIL